MFRKGCACFCLSSNDAVQKCTSQIWSDAAGMRSNGIRAGTSPDISQAPANSRGFQPHKVMLLHARHACMLCMLCQLLLCQNTRTALRVQCASTSCQPQHVLSQGLKPGCISFLCGAGKTHNIADNEAEVIQPANSNTQSLRSEKDAPVSTVISLQADAEGSKSDQVRRSAISLVHYFIKMSPLQHSAYSAFCTTACLAVFCCSARFPFCALYASVSSSASFFNGALR